jgi:hypothetical protein
MVLVRERLAVSRLSGMKPVRLSDGYTINRCPILPITITTFRSHFDNSVFHIARSQHYDAQ